MADCGNSQPVKTKRKDSIDGMIIAQTPKKRQVDRLLEYLIFNESISGMECIQELGILNYKGRIHDLRKMGYTISTKMATSVNSKGETKTYARYYLKGIPQI